MKNNYVRFLALLSIVTTLMACGGGDETSDENTAPVANAGLDQTVVVGDTVELNGLNSFDAEGDQLGFSWSPSSENEASTSIINDDQAQASFVASAEGKYTILLVVNDSILDSEVDSVVINVIDDRQIIQPDSVSASSEFSGDFSADNTINGSGIDGELAVDKPHDIYRQDNHWTTASSTPTEQWIEWYFDTSKSLGGIYIWNHQSNNIANNDGYEPVRFDLTLFDANDTILLSLDNVELAPDNQFSQAFGFGSVIDDISRVLFEVVATQSSTPYTGLAEVAFDRELVENVIDDRQIIQPDSVSASTEFSGDYSADNTINGSGIDGELAVDKPHDIYRQDNHWTTAASTPTEQWIEWHFNTSKSLGGIYIWNHQSNNIANNDGYEPVRFDLTLFDANDTILLSLENVELAPDNQFSQAFGFGSVIDDISRVLFEVVATQTSTPYTGLAEVAFDRELVE